MTIDLPTIERLATILERSGVGAIEIDDAGQSLKLVMDRSVATSGSRPMMTNSVVPMAKELKARTKRASGISKFLLQSCKEFGDGFFVALVENPLAKALGGHQSGTVQCAEMGGNCGLRQTATLELTGADAQFQRVFLGRKMLMRIFKLIEDFKPSRMSQCLQYLSSVHDVHRVNIENLRFMYRWFSIYQGVR